LRAVSVWASPMRTAEEPASMRTTQTTLRPATETRLRRFDTGDGKGRQPAAAAEEGVEPGESAQIGVLPIWRQGMDFLVVASFGRRGRRTRRTYGLDGGWE
jgi:hypothetical protein